MTDRFRKRNNVGEYNTIQYNLKPYNARWFVVLTEELCLDLLSGEAVTPSSYIRTQGYVAMKRHEHSKKSKNFDKFSPRPLNNPLSYLN